MRLGVLASGSAGNAAVVEGRCGTTVLVDAGVSLRQLKLRAEICGFDLEAVEAVLISHEHSDHIRALDVMTRRLPRPFWATAGTALRLRLKDSSAVEIFAVGETVEIGGLRIDVLATSHDAAEPVAFVIDDGESRLGVLTDTGIAEKQLLDALGDLDCLILECNHDADLLRHGPYPWPLKQRIASRYGHLANHQAASVLERLDGRVGAVVAAHLSAKNNTPELAVASLEAACSRPCVAAAQDRPLLVAIESGSASFEFPD